MRNLVAISIFALFPFVATAGVGGGGVGPRPGMGMFTGPNSEIVFHVSQEDGRVRFAYAELIQDQWQIQTFQMDSKTLLAQPDMVQALEASKTCGDWVQVNSR